ncbi:MAG: hypothetical protein M3Z01_06970 [Thermoproteota archaeon]|nr:hypothetical protein [Thermoproteota archaeon]
MYKIHRIENKWVGSSSYFINIITMVAAAAATLTVAAATARGVNAISLVWAITGEIMDMEILYFSISTTSLNRYRTFRLRFGK